MKKKLLKEVGFSERDINRFYLEFKNILLGEYEQYLNYIKKEEESLLEQFSISKWKLIFQSCLKILDMEEFSF